RSAAVECLCRVPGSAHTARNLERLRPLVVLGRRLLGKRLEITLPESLDKAAARDGINAKPPAQQKIGERAYWLMQMISMAAPTHWCERFQCDINTFIQAALATDYATDLIPALSAAGVRHSDTAWIIALSAELLQWCSQPERQAVASEMIPAL